MQRLKRIGRLCLALLLAAAALAQDTRPEQPTTAAPVQQQGAKRSQQKITPKQAKELFRSVDEILNFVSKDTGLPIKNSVKRQLVDRDQVLRFIQDRMSQDEEARRLAQTELVLKKFGLIPRNFDLKAFLLELLQEQVAGFYDAKTKTVYLLDWVAPEQQKPVLAHELTHALQDQNFGLQEMSKEARKSDPDGLKSDERLAALQAVTEGQAMIVLLDYNLAPMESSVAKFPSLADAMSSGLTPAAPGMVVFNRAPLFLRQVLLFPYSYGTIFERDVLLAGGQSRAFAEVLRNPPQDTRQILEPKTYLDGQLVPPLKSLEFAQLARDYKMWDRSTVGEFDVLLLLNEYSTNEVAKELSREWRGGYYWAALTPEAAKQQAPTRATNDLALAYISRWANAGAARRFAALYATSVPKRYRGASEVGGQASAQPQAEVSVEKRDGPGMVMQAQIEPRLPGPARWQTSEGQVMIEAQGDRVLVLENFDAETAARIREATFGN
jgi:hypothetical protein